MMDLNMLQVSSHVVRTKNTEYILLDRELTSSSSMPHIIRDRYLQYTLYIQGYRYTGIYRQWLQNNTGFRLRCCPGSGKCS